MKIGIVCLLLLVTSSVCFAAGQCTEQVNSYIAGKKIGLTVSPDSPNAAQAKANLERIERLRARGYSDCDILAQMPEMKKSNNAVSQAVGIVGSLFGKK